VTSCVVVGMSFKSLTSSAGSSSGGANSYERRSQRGSKEGESTFKLVRKRKQWGKCL